MKLLYRTLLVIPLIGISSEATASSLAELAITGAATATAAGQVVENAPPPAPPSPAEVARAEKISQLNKINSGEAEQNRQIDNSRTDIRLFNQMITEYNRDRVHSLLFTKEEISDINLAINTYLKSIGRGGDLTFDEEAFLSRLGGLKKSTTGGESRFFTYPQFFLDSLVYHSPSDWLIWINGEKITPQTPRESNNIHVVAVDGEKATIAWFPLSMNRVMDVWKIMKNDAIIVDREHSQVVFTLKPNQTFSSYVMRVLEGQVEPIIVEATDMDEFGEELNAIRNAAPADIPPPVIAPGENTEGLGGLINRYEHMNKAGTNDPRTPPRP